jgi:replicative DNA helicase
MPIKITDTPLQLKEKFDETFEEKVIQLCLRNKQFAAKYFSILKTGYFSSIYCKALFQGFYTYYSKYKKLPTQYEMSVFVVKEYPGNDKMVEALNDKLKDVYTSEIPNPDYFDELLVEFIKRAEVSVILWDSIQNFDTLNINQLNNKIAAVAGIENKTADLGISSDDFVHRLAIKDDDRSGIPSTFKNFNAVVRGGLRPGELVVFMAPTNRGKTHTLINFGRSFLTMGASVAHYSLEMPEEDIMDRYIASMTQIRIADLSAPLMYEKVSGLLQDYAVFSNKKMQIKFFPAKTISVRDIAAHLGLLEEAGKKPDIVVIDYIDLLKPTKDRKDKRLELGDIYEEVRALGHTFGVPIVTASQTNRQGELNDWDWKKGRYSNRSKALSVAHIAEDWSKAATADYIFGIRKSMKHPLAGKDGLLILDTIKSRHSARDTRLGYTMAWDKCYMEDINIDGLKLDDVVEDEDEK